MWKKVWKFSHHTLLSIMWREDLYRTKVCGGFQAFLCIVCTRACLYLSAEWVPPLHQVLIVENSVCWKTLCTKEKIVSGVYFICFDFIWFIWFLGLIWFAFIWFIWFRNCLLFRISYCFQLCWIIRVPYFWNF